MGLFDRFKKKTQTAAKACPAQQVEPDTLCILVMDRVLQDASQAGEIVKSAFGSEVPCVLLATASPYKFCGSVSEALFGEQESDEFAMMDALETRTHIQAPKLLKQLRSMPIRHQDVIKRSEMKSIISQKVGVLWQ